MRTIERIICAVAAMAMCSCGSNVDYGKLGPVMEDVFAGGTVNNETVMFMDYGQEKTLLFDADDIISVKSYDNAITYEAGKDYALVDGKIKILEGSSIPCITTEGYYSGTLGDQRGWFYVDHDGKRCTLFWGEAHYMADWQVNVTYSHSDSWQGFRQPSCKDQFSSLLKKFQKGEDVTIIFYGDSITHGCSTSFVYGYAPFQHSYAMLLAESLAAAYGYRLAFTDVSDIKGAPVIPCESIEYGNRGTLRYINTAVGGWTSKNGNDNFDSYVGDFVKEYGCDLFVNAYGMNDGNIDAADFAKSIKSLNDKVLALDPDASLLIVSTMVPNPEEVQNWYAHRLLQEPELLKLAEECQSEGQPCAVTQMTSVSEAVLARKDFKDWSGNNINHPNDFFARIYAQTLLRTITGY